MLCFDRLVVSDVSWQAHAPHAHLGTSHALAPNKQTSKEGKKAGSYLIYLWRHAHASSHGYGSMLKLT